MFLVWVYDTAVSSYHGYMELALWCCAWEGGNMEESFGCQEARHAQIRSSTLTMHYMDWGGDKPPLLALHGLSSSAHWYDKCMPYLTPYFHCIAPDQRAHGLTNQPNTGYDWETLSADLLFLLDELRIEKVALLGHSWGASVAGHFAVQHPERVEALILIDGGVQRQRDPETMWEDYRLRLRQRDICGHIEKYISVLKKEHSAVWDSELEHMLLSMPELFGDNEIREYLSPDSHQQVIWSMFSDPLTALYEHIQSRTLIVSAEGNTELSRSYLPMKLQSVNDALKRIPHSESVWVTDAPHDISFYKPETLVRHVLDFLS